MNQESRSNKMDSCLTVSEFERHHTSKLVPVQLRPSMKELVLTAIGCFVVFWTMLFVSIQAIKNNLEVLLFFFTATGIPVSAMYCMFIGSRIWAIRGGAE
jgi:hypothetical protein